MDGALIFGSLGVMRAPVPLVTEATPLQSIGLTAYISERITQNHSIQCHSIREVCGQIFVIDFVYPAS